MRATKPLIAVALLAIWPSVAHGESLAKTIKKAVDRATLDQPGTKPFHFEGIARAKLRPGQGLWPNRDRRNLVGLAH